MKHFLEISQLTVHQINSLLERALQFKALQQFPGFPKQSVANLFYENSTRTRVSFELAARRLSMEVINFNLEQSSENKGELIEDTIQTLTAMGIHYYVIRHKQEGLQQHLADRFGGLIHIINAGDGMHAHPSQALLDMMTIKELKPDVTQLKIAIVGDIKHSRVANSFQCICKKLGVGQLVLVAPKIWQPTSVHYGYVTQDLKEGVLDADVVMCLRVQQERLKAADHLDLNTYIRDYAITASKLLHAKPGALVMHPGPINRAIEIAAEVADGPQSVILQQVNNGVYARMAILESLIVSSD
ncbi:MAG: aspartate carbamoyltransferase catalytic subunit [Legionella sp.]|nr:aspartate carbamoyltransferase catalytic subunit [Legionella sp.]